MKKAMKIIAGIGVVIVLLGAGMLFFATRGLEEGKNLVIQDVDLTQIADGTYTGQHEAGRWTNTVQVVVQEGEITDIQLVDGFEQEKAKEKVYQAILQHQTLDVDVLSGATVSSKAYIKAVENALGNE